MTVALIDNGSLEPDAHRNLRTVAAALAGRTGRPVAAVSWKHSDRVPTAALGGEAAWTLGPWLRGRLAAGDRDFLLVPFFISPLGAIGSALRTDLEKFRAELGHFEFGFAPGLGGSLGGIVADRVRETLDGRRLRRPAVIVVDHGGPSPASAAVRDAVAGEVRIALGASIGPLAAASMESPDGAGFEFNQPLLAAQLGAPGYDRGDVVLAPLFLSPGRHAGPEGDLARLARAAEAARPGLRCHFTGLVGNHPRVVEVLARNLDTQANALGTARSTS